MESTRSTERELLKDNVARHGAGHWHSSPYGPPQIFVPYATDGIADTKAIRDLETARATAGRFVDLFSPMLLELMLTLHPGYKNDKATIDAKFAEFRQSYVGARSESLVGSFVLYPNGVLLRILPRDDHYRLRTSRNLGLFTLDEQMRLRDARVAVIGLSVGSAAALSLAMEGVGNFFLTDFDQLACSNLNRLASSLSMIGVEKTKIIAQKIWDIDPYANVVTSEQGFSKEAETELFTSLGKPDLVIDAMDSAEAKFAVRAACRKHGVPLVSVFDIGDGVVQVDTERYDLDPSYPPFHGALNVFAQRGAPPSYIETAFTLLNQEHLPFRMAESFYLACRNEWPGVSQLAGTVSIAAGAVARTARKIILGETVVPQFIVDIGEKSDPDHEVTRAADRDKTLRFIEAATTAG